MTRRITRSYLQSDTISTVSSNVKNKRLRERKVILIDSSSSSSDDEYIPIPAENLLKTPRKTKLKLDEAVTPPKQKKSDLQHDQTAPSNCQTPSMLLDRLSLISPIKCQTSQNRKSLFQETNEISQNKNVGSKVNKISSDEENCDNRLDEEKDSGICSVEEKEFENETTNKNFYRNARRALHSSLPTSLPGREVELCDLKNFIKTNLKNGTSGSLYVSGPPGTGKTASLNIILQEKDVSMTFISPDVLYCFVY